MIVNTVLFRSFLLLFIPVANKEGHCMVLANKLLNESYLLTITHMERIKQGYPISHYCPASEDPLLPLW